MVATLTPPKPAAPLRIQPMLNERQDAFVERADRALRTSIPDRNSRMSAIAQAWGASGNESRLQQRVREALAAVGECPVDQLDTVFVTRPNRPIFPEHSTIGPDGSPQRYDRAALAAIVDRCNRRILDTGDLAAMSAGHTPTQEQQAKGMPMPDLVGFTGPFRLGLIGTDRPRWCIFGDEHIFRDDYARVKKMPRRSPEVWMEPRMADRVMDPIAVLGAETPRLDTGLARFSRGRLDSARYTNVARYSLGAMPGGANTFVQDYSAGDDDMDDNAIQSLVAAVIQGLQATPQWAWITEQMGQGDGNPVPTDADQGPTPSADATPVPGATDPNATPDAGGAPAPDATVTPDAGAPSPTPDAAPPVDSTPPAADSRPTDNTGGGATPEELASMGDDEKDEYSRLSSPAHQAGYMVARRRHAKPAGAMQYANPIEKSRYSRMEAENVSLKGEVAALRAQRTFQERYSKLSELNQFHEFNLEEEAQECSGMKDEQFQRHLERIATRYSRRDPNGGMPVLFTPPLDQPKPDDGKKERYSRRAIEIASRTPGMDWDTAYGQAKREIDAS